MALIMGLFSKLFRNARKPEGFLGKMMVNGMNDGRHAAMSFVVFLMRLQQFHRLPVGT